MTNRREIATFAGMSLAAVAASRFAFSQEPKPSRARRPLRLLILGGTGFTGPHQVRYALARGHSVTLFNRGRQKKDWPGDVEELIGDRNSSDLKSLAGHSWDVCIDNPTSLPFWVRDAGVALKGHIRHYVFISTVSAYADNHAPDADESAPLAVYQGKDPLAETQESLRANGGELYGPLKAASEKEALRQFPGITTIIRPGLIVGPGDETDRFTYWPARIERAGDVLAPGDGTDAVQFIDARDLAEWTIRMVETRSFGAYNATGPGHTLTMREMLAAISEALRVKPTLVWVPATFLDQQHIESWSDMPVWVPGQGEDSGFARRSIARALASGLTFRSLATTAIDTLAWLHGQSQERQTTLKAGLTALRESAALMAWKNRSVLIQRQTNGEPGAAIGI